VNDELQAFENDHGTYPRMKLFLARVTEEGNCWTWTGSLQNNVPMMPMGKRQRYIPARRYVMQAMGIPAKAGMAFLGATCGNLSCVKPEHIKQRTVKEQMRVMGKNVTNGNELLRRHKIALSKRKLYGKLTPETALEIYSSTESGDVLAERYGVSKSLVNRVRRGDSWKTALPTSPFAGLL
jgi:hypothetical protein